MTRTEMAFGDSRRRGLDAHRARSIPSRRRCARDGLEAALDAGVAILAQGRKRARRGRGRGARARGGCLLQRRARQRADRAGLQSSSTRRSWTGATRRAGAVSGMRTTRAPISLARRLMEHGPHVFLSGDGADEFAARARARAGRQRLVRYCPSGAASSTKLLAAGGVRRRDQIRHGRRGRGRSSMAMSRRRPRPAG